MDDTTTVLQGGRQVWSPPGRLEGLPPYPLADVPDIKARLLAEGRTVIDLGVGDPGLPVPGPEKSEDFCRRLLIDSGVVLLPGSAMGPGGEGFVRASLAIHEDRWEEAGRRIQEAL